MAWFKRTKKGIQTPTELKKDVPKGLWYKSPTGKIVDAEELERNYYVSPEDGYHVRIGSKEYFEILFDDNKFKELDKNLDSKDSLKFVDTKKYPDRLKEAQDKTGLKDAVRTAVGKSMGNDLVIACMDFSFIGGSMGSVVGEKIARAADYALKKKLPLLLFQKWWRTYDGSRPFLNAIGKNERQVSPTFKSQNTLYFFVYRSYYRGTTASFAMLGDINISEPGALIGFAGPRVVRDTTGKELPEGFQTAEFLLEHGFLDFISHRKDLKRKINLYIDLIQNQPLREKKLA
ncbi:MAG: acetyl-CoA carboxylase carboxyltransferase subunit beta [Flavobacteriaceae bacterium]